MPDDDKKELKIGREVTLYYYRLICPYCDASEDSDLGEYSRFERMEFHNDHGWKRKCLTCGKCFWIE
jgi:hypothetical protein